MYNSVVLEKWVVIHPPRTSREVNDFIDAIQNVARGMSYKVGKPRVVELTDDRVQTYLSEVESYAAKDPKLIMIIVPNNAGDRYAAIKTLTCVKRAIPTQVVVNRTLNPKKGGVMSIATKVLIQMNCKLGGAPWMVKFPLSGVMTIGFDVTHDTKNKSNSFGAFVASMDLKKQVKYYSSVTSHRSGEELSNNLNLHLVQALKRFYQNHGALPDRVFFYRDGVGEGDIEYVFTQEVQQLTFKLAEIYEKRGGGKNPMFSFIVVNKRINTRIFLNKGRIYDNPPSGTVVDNTITLPERSVFILDLL